MSRPHCADPDDCKAKGSGHCRPCVGRASWADPEQRERNIAAIKARYDRPGAREARAEAMRATSRKSWADPEIAARMTEASRQNVALTVLSEKCQAAAQTPEARAKRSRNGNRTKYAWCPPSFYPEYRRLVASAGIKPKEARRMIEEQMAAEARREIASVDRAMREREQRRKREEY